MTLLLLRCLIQSEAPEQLPVMLNDHITVNDEELDEVPSEMVCGRLQCQ